MIGWVRQADVNGEVTKSPLYLTVNKKTLEIYYGKNKGDRDTVHKICILKLD